MAKFHYRIPPCPSYDFVGIEAWLEGMAEKGLFLDKDGFVFGFFQFQKGTPRKIKYRLEANTRQSPLDIGEPEAPEEEALNLNAEFGWEYWGKFREFDIYRSEDENVRELNTDPVVQAMALDAVRSRTGFFLTFLCLMFVGLLLGFLGTPDSTLRSLIRTDAERITRYFLLVVCVLFGAAYLFREKGSGKVSGMASKIAVLLIYLGTVFSVYRVARSTTPLLDILDRGWLWWLAFGGFYASCLFHSIVSYLHIVTLQHRLRRGEMPYRGKKRSLLWLVPEILPFVLLLALPLASGYGGRPSDTTPIEEFSGELPFVTMAQLAPEREYISKERGGSYSNVRSWSDILSPVNYDWWENAWLDAPDGSRYGGSLSITYHEAANEAIAKRLITEYAGTNQAEDSLIPDSIDADAFDHLGIYPSTHPTILIRKGTIVICAYCSVQSWGDHENLYPVWLEQMAAILT